MSADKIKQIEQQHMDQVIAKIKTAEAKNQAKIKQTKADEQQLQADFPNNLRIKTETYSGMFETALTVRQQQQLLNERQNDWQHAVRRLDILKKMERKPYFARIDFQESANQQPETIYIGLGSFADRPDNFLIYDWRAPISSIYYDGQLGKVSLIDNKYFIVFATIRTSEAILLSLVLFEYEQIPKTIFSNVSDAKFSSAGIT